MHLAPCSLPSALPSCPQWRCGAALTCCHLGNCCQSERACWDGWPELAAGWRAAAGDVTDAPLRTNRPLSLSPSHRSVWLVDPSPLRDAPWDRTLVKSNVQAYGEEHYFTLMFTFLHVDTLKRSQRAKPHSDLGYPDITPNPKCPQNYLLKAQTTKTSASKSMSIWEKSSPCDVCLLVSRTCLARLWRITSSSLLFEVTKS